MSSLADLQLSYYARHGGGSPVVDSDQKANASASAVITASGTQRAYLDKVIVGGLGATSAGSAALTIAGAAGDDITFPVVVPAGATVALTPLILEFDPPLEGAALGDDITVTLAAFGAGNTRADLCALGHLV